MAGAPGQSNWRAQLRQSNKQCIPTVNPLGEHASHNMKPTIGACPFAGQKIGTAKEQQGENPNRRRQLAHETHSRRGKELGKYLVLIINA